MPSAPKRYERHRPETTVLYGLVQEHLESFLLHGRSGQTQPKPDHGTAASQKRPIVQAGATSVTQGMPPHRAAWLRDHSAEALAAVEKEAIRRMGRSKQKKLVTELRILEPGLWSALPDEVWAMELRLAEKQGADFRLRSPDEADARTTFEATHPKLVKARKQLLNGLTPARGLFEDSEPDSDREQDVVDEDDVELAAEGVS